VTTPSSGGGGFQHPESNRGGGDAVPDTPGVAGHGAHPGGRTEDNEPTSAPVASGGGFGVVGWVVVGVLILIALIYGLGFVARG
jgi:hypothetical protein